MRAEEEFLKELDTLEALAIEQYRNAVAHSAVELRIKIENGTRNIQDGKDNVSFFFLEIHLPGILIFSEKSVFFTQVKWPMRLPKGMFLRLGQVCCKGQASLIFDCKGRYFIRYWNPYIKQNHKSKLYIL